jgi:hypothetical protein
MNINEKIEKPDNDGSFDDSLRKAVRLKEREELLAYIKNQDSNLQTERDVDLATKKTTKRIPLRRILAYAASICIIAVLGLLFFKSNSIGSTEKLVEKYYKPYPNIYKPITRSQNPEINNEMLALAAYEAGRYDLAYELFTELEESNSYVDLFTAISSWELDKKEEAKVAMDELVKVKSDVQRTAIWYSAIFALEEGDTEVAKAFLNQLTQAADSKADFSKEANEILETLN